MRSVPFIFHEYRLSLNTMSGGGQDVGVTEMSKTMTDFKECLVW